MTRNEELAQGLRYHWKDMAVIIEELAGSYTEVSAGDMSGSSYMSSWALRELLKAPLVVTQVITY